MSLAFTKAILVSLITIINCSDGQSCATGDLSNPFGVTTEPSHLQASISQVATTEAELAEVQSSSSDPLSIAKVVTPNERVLLKVPFSSQAPFHNWNPPYDEACEETAIIMVEYHLRGADLHKETADTEINEIVAWQKERGFIVDIDVSDTAFHAKNFYGRNTHVYYNNDVTEQNIKKLLTAGYPVIIPAAGKMLANPNYRNGGPPYHMVVLTGYDDANFFAHDPGTQFGANHSYSTQTIMEAIHDWNGSKSTIDTGRKAMLVITR